MLYQDYYPVSQEFLDSLKDSEKAQVSQIKLQAELCQFCELYLANYDPAFIKEELLDFIQSCSPQRPAVLALSGGKDSLSALYILRKILNLPTIAFLYQNGFIPEAVIQQAQAICDQFGVPLQIASKPLFDVFKQEYRSDPNGQFKAKTGLDFCQLCSVEINRFAVSIMEACDTDWLVLGNKVYTELSPRVSSIKLKTFNQKPRKLMNLLFAVGLNTKQQAKILKEIQWKSPDLLGYTSNCYVPGLVEQARYERLGFHSDQGYIELELRSGTYTQAEAKTLLKPETIDLHAYIDSLPQSIRTAIS